MDGSSFSKKTRTWPKKTIEGNNLSINILLGLKNEGNNFSDKKRTWQKKMDGSSILNRKRTWPKKTSEGSNLSNKQAQLTYLDVKQVKAAIYPTEKRTWPEKMEGSTFLKRTPTWPKKTIEGSSLSKIIAYLA